MFWWLFTASLPLRGNSEGHVVQSEPAEHLMGLWCCTAECVLFNSIKMLLASRDIVNLPNKETPLPRCWSGIRTATSSASTWFTASPAAHPLCWPEELPAMKSSGGAWGGCELLGPLPLLPSAWAAANWALQPGSAPALPWHPLRREGWLQSEWLAQFAGRDHSRGVEKHPSPCAPRCWQQSREFRGASQGE